MMIDDLEVWAAALRGGHGMISGLDFIELLRDSVQRDAVIVIAAEYHVAAARPTLPQAVPQLSDAQLNLMSELVRAPLQSRQLLLFVRHGLFVLFERPAHQSNGGEDSRGNFDLSFSLSGGCIRW
jgi:hypothetical protein